MRISHKWSHTGTIHQAQSQSHNLTFSHKISGSYPPGSAYPSHIFTLFHVTTTGTILQAQFQISHQWRLNTSLSLTITHLSHQHSFTSQHVSISHFNNLVHFITHAHHVSITTTYSIHKSTIHIMYILNSYHITNSCQITHSLIFYIFSKELTYILVY